MSDRRALGGRRVFVSGGAGVIGLEMLPRLLEHGATVYVGDLKPRPRQFPRQVRYRQGDLNYLAKEEIEHFAPEIFIHLAASFERSTESYAFWEENFWNNVRLSHHLMTVLKDSPSLKRVVFASSYLIYDPARYQFPSARKKAVALKETDPVLPRNLTGMAKLAHEIELRFLNGFLQPKCSAVCARIYRGYGRNSQDVISRWVRALIAGEPIRAYRLEGLFDYIYAKDSAEGLIRLAAVALTGVVNLGTGRARRVQDIVNILRRHFPAMRVVEQSSDIPFEASEADMTAFRAAVGWAPAYDLEQAIPEIITHEKSERGDREKSQQDLGHVLVTSASRKAPLVRSAQKAARKIHPDIRVFAGDLDPEALTRYVADEFWQMPRTEDHEIDALVAGCKKRGIRTIFPTRDAELSFWAQHQPRFESEGIDVVVSPAASVRICLDKLAFARFGAEHGFPFIPAAEHPDQVGEGSYAVKERYGAGARKIGLGLGREAALEHAKTLKEPIYQPFVAGREISIDAWLDRSYQVKGLVLRSRDSVVDGESQVTTTFRDAAIEAVAQQILHALKLRGPVVMQVLIDVNHGVHVIECNTRFGGASTASISAGLDVFYWSSLESRGVDLEDYPFHRLPAEVRLIRVREDIYIHGDRF
jgi:carbamoyl-phosphate synthase large subunit